VETGLLVCLIAGAQGQREQRFVLLPASEATKFASDYPRAGPQSIGGSWQPTTSQVEVLESNLSLISSLRSGGAPNGTRIEHPERYYRQYLAVLRGGHALIFVNSLCDIKYNTDWRTHIAVVMDGGNCFWQAWYDPTTSKFSELMVNGVG
jgi:hypothetical protein